MRRPIWQLAVLFLATFGLYSIHWWSMSWRHLHHRWLRLAAFVGSFALVFVAGPWGWLSFAAALLVLLISQQSLNRHAELPRRSFSSSEKLIVVAALVIALFVGVYNIAGPMAQ